MAMVELQNFVLGIFGRKGSGKSTELRSRLARCPRLLLFDAMGEHRWVPNRLTDLETVEDFLAWASEQRTFAAAYVPMGRIEEEFDALADMVFEEGNLTFAIEEIPMLCGPAWQSEALDRVVRLGRHRRLDLVYTAQRVAETSRRITAMTDQFVWFSTTEPRDLDGVADRCGREVAARVARLTLYEKLTWNAVEQSGMGVRSALNRRVGQNP